MEPDCWKRKYSRVFSFENFGALEQWEYLARFVASLNHKALRNEKDTDDDDDNDNNNNNNNNNIY